MATLRHPLYSQGQRVADVAFPNSIVDASGRELLTLEGARLVPSVEVLNVSRNRLVNFFGLVSLPRMRCLYADCNMIESFAGMSFQPGLEILSMDDNPISRHPMFRIMALLCAGESLRIINHKAVSEAERSLCQTFGGPSGDVAKLVSFGWTDLGKKPEPLSTYSDIVAHAQANFNEKVRSAFNVFASEEMLKFSLQNFVEQMRVEEGIAGFATAASPLSHVPKERSQHGAYGMAIGKNGAFFISDIDLPASDAALELRDHLYNAQSPQASSLAKRPPWDFTPAPVPPGPVFLHEKLVMDSDSYNANDYVEQAPHSDRGGPARHFPKGRDIYSDVPFSKGQTASAAQYQEEVDRAVAIDTARTFLNRVKRGGTTDSLSEPVNLKYPGPTAAEREDALYAQRLRQNDLEEAERVRAWVEFNKLRPRHRGAHVGSPRASNGDVAHFSRFSDGTETSKRKDQPEGSSIVAERTPPKKDGSSVIAGLGFNGTSLRTSSQELVRAHVLNSRVAQADPLYLASDLPHNLILSSSESDSIVNVTVGPVHIYTSIPKSRGPVETLRNAMLAINMLDKTLAIAVGGAADAKVVALIPLGDIADAELDVLPVEGSSIPSNGSRATLVRLSLINESRMDFVPCDPSRRATVARGIFKLLTFALSGISRV